MVGLRPSVVQVGFSVTPRFLLRDSRCPWKLLVAFPVEDNVVSSMWVIFGHSAVFQRKVASPSYRQKVVEEEEVSTQRHRPKLCVCGDLWTRVASNPDRLLVGLPSRKEDAGHYCLIREQHAWVCAVVR